MKDVLYGDQELNGTLGLLMMFFFEIIILYEQNN